MKKVILIVLLILIAAGAFIANKTRKTQEPPVVSQSNSESLTAANAEAPTKPKVSLYMAIPQGIYVPVGAIMDKFSELHPEVEFDSIVDTPEAMADTIRKNKDKPDIFISPGGHEAVVLANEGYIDPSTLVAFGSYDLALLVPASNPGEITKLEDLLNPKVKTISISDPDLNASCYAARMAFQNIGLWDKIKSKIKVTGCCMSSYKWITDGRAEANIQFVGCPIDPKTEKLADQSKAKFAASFPRNSYYTPRTVAGMLKTTKYPEVCKEFLAFMVEKDNIKLMIEKKKLRNDQELPFTSSPWSSEDEKNPQSTQALAGVK